MLQFQFDNLTIELFDDSTYSYGSTDNKFNYLKQYFGGGGHEFPVSKHGIKILDKGKEINSCIIIGSAGATGIHKNSALIDNDKLLICCCETLFCLTLPELNLHWQTKVDTATCFQVFKLDNDYLVHGELEVSRINSEEQYNGNLVARTFLLLLKEKKNFNLNLTT